MNSSASGRRDVVKQSLERHAAIIERLMEIGNTPGISISVLCENEVVLERGYGHANLQAKTKATPATVYPIASITKTMTAAACGILVAEGRLKWDEPISRYLPDLSLPSRPVIQENATLIDVLSHRTGLEDQPTLYVGPNGTPLFSDADSMYRALNSMTAEVGSFRDCWSYCPPLYALVTLVIERISGMNLADFFASHIFQPLGMFSTSMIGTSGNSKSPSFATPYTRTSQGDWIERIIPPQAYGFPYDASMGVQSTVVDMMKWARAVIANLPSPSPPTSINAEHRGKVLQEADVIFKRWCELPPNEGGNPAYGLGWFLQYGQFIYDDMFDQEGQTDLLAWPCTLPKPKEDEKPQPILYHSGLGHGFTSSMHIYPYRGDAVVILGNSSHAGDAVDCISRLVTSILCDHDLSLQDLEYSLRFYTGFEVGRWNNVDNELRKQQENVPKGKVAPKTSSLVGRYLNDDLDFEISIVFSPEISSRDRDGTRALVGTRIGFGKAPTVGIDLWSFCDDTLCFFPNERDYQRWAMSYMGHWAQFLIHLTIEDGSDPIAGFWWQFDATRDGIWFHRLDTGT